MNRLITAAFTTTIGVVALATAAGAIPDLDPSPSVDGGESAMVPLSPTRILDTRNGIGTAGATSPIGPNGEIVLQVSGAGGVPTGATSVVLNITATGATLPTFVTMWEDGTPMPVASVLNVTPGEDVANMVTATLPTSGRLRIFNASGNVHVIADVAGYYRQVDEKMLFAVVQDDGTFNRGDGAISSSRTAVGIYTVTFAKDVSNCGFTASAGSVGVNNPPAEFAAVTRMPAVNEAVRVRTYDVDGNAADSSFHLHVICP
jgi:hypothetical protein